MKELCKFVTHAVSNEKQISTFQPPILESNILMSVYIYVPHHLLEMLRTAQISNPWVVSIWNGSQGQFGQKVVKNLEVQRSPWKSLRTWTQETFPESSPTVWVLEQTVISWTRLSKPACGEWRSWWVQQHGLRTARSFSWGKRAFLPGTYQQHWGFLLLLQKAKEI